MPNTFAGIHTMTDAIVVKAPCLLNLATQEGVSYKSVAALLKLHIVALDAFLRLRRRLSPEEVDLAADEIMQTYGGALSFADIYVIFRDAKLGRYGEFYESLSCAKIIKWVDEYAERRMTTAYEINRNTDRQNYGITGGKDDKAVLRKLGYAVGDDGRITIDPIAVADHNRRRDEEQARAKARRAAAITTDNEYAKLKLQHQAQ